MSNRGASTCFVFVASCKRTWTDWRADWQRLCWLGPRLKAVAWVHNKREPRAPGSIKSPCACVHFRLRVIQCHG
jgi:hypothetical protein